ncbi:hypothetical protein NR996_04940 [Lactobacillus rodentium]|uniref:Uncharacterized protein n=1 Tax=Lactobacillus rodentium TaxID=947835 RepID=A0A2Z6T779_9LACO|nr:hypothetical protein [Lactobacillus rodentium]MCR1894753.1 hypothetical protein [Lactobacillus rodentium]GBG04996.1 hypothetical protein LrDSM24759_09100 [Lactobacillus rodentium]
MLGNSILQCILCNAYIDNLNNIILELKEVYVITRYTWLKYIGIVGIYSLISFYFPSILGICIKVLIQFLKFNDVLLFLGYLILYLLSYYFELWMLICIILYFILMIAVLIFYMRISFSDDNFNEEYKNKNIGSFYNFFNLKFGISQLNKLKDIAKNNYTLRTFLSPTKIEEASEINGKLIIRNLKFLKKKNIFVFLKLKNTILEKKENHFLNIGAILISMTALIISSLNNSIIFGSIFQPLIDSFNNIENGQKYTSIGDGLLSIVRIIPFGIIAALLIIIVSSLIKEWEKYENRSFYTQIFLFIEEAEK